MLKLMSLFYSKLLSMQIQSVKVVFIDCKFQDDVKLYIVILIMLFVFRLSKSRMCISVKKYRGRVLPQ